MIPTKILIVEDNEDNSILTDKILRYYGFDTVIIANGTAALEYCMHQVPDLILMDLSLPDIDGIKVARLLKQNPRYQTVPIIALSAQVTPGILETLKEAQISDFITKPFLPPDLIAVIRKYL